MNQELRDTLLRYACALLGGDRDTAEDVTQEALIALTRALGPVRDPEAYARRAVYNLCARHHRDRRGVPVGDVDTPAPRPEIPTSALLQRVAALVHLGACGDDGSDGSTGVVVPPETRVDRELLERLLMFHAAVAAALPLRDPGRLRADLGRKLSALDERAFSCRAREPGDGERPLPRRTVHAPATLVRQGALLALRLCRDLSEREAERLARRVVEEQGLDLSELALIYVHEPDLDPDDETVDDVRAVLEELFQAGETADLWLLADTDTERQLVVYPGDDGELRAAVPGNGFLHGRDRLTLAEQERLRLLGWQGPGEDRDFARRWDPGTDLTWVAMDLLDTFWVLHDNPASDLELELAA